MDHLIDRVIALGAMTQYPIVGVSGHAGSGKSTLARTLENRISGSVRVRVDDFLDPVLIHRRSGDWTGVWRDRLADEVLGPFAAGRPVYVRPLDWSTGTLGRPQRLREASMLCVDGIGIFHPEITDRFDFRIWVDTDPLTAVSRGQMRDRAAGLDHDALWTRVWSANDADFDERFAPRDRADVIFDNNGASIE